ncbi:hypothetical protein [Nocardioides sp. R-C-SC26]|uniref:hypothetical protein n=1 Tax=Nocardioides sp. R-C-SC26 TaxID=2870414 RepID=UPI001E2CC54C|nr:hypothetical protein [Nocardioides sp. R-C-SC26]
MTDADYSGEYWRLEGLIEEVVEAACQAVLRINGYYQNSSGGYSASGGPEEYSVPGPGSGQYPDDPLPNYVGPDGFPEQVQSIGDIYRLMEEQIPPIFDSLLGLPHEGIFESKADDVRLALMQLSASGSRGAGDGSSDAPSSIDYEGNSTLALATDVAQTLKTWQGAAADAFSQYLNVFTVVVGNQALACEVLRISLYQQSEFFRRLRSDAVELAHSAIEAFNGCGGITVGDVKAAMSVVGTVNTVLGWFPAFSVITGPVSTGMSVTGLLVDTFGGEAAEPNDLAARSPHDVIAKMNSAVSDLQDRSRTVEGDIEKGLENLKSLLDQTPAARPSGGLDQEAFRLARPEQTYSATGVDDFITPGVVVNADNIANAADLLEKDLAYEMGQAWTALERVPGYQSWARDSRIGTGIYGSSQEYFIASLQLEEEIRETANEMQWAAEMLRAIWQDVSGVDDNVGQDFQAVRDRIITYDTPPAATPPPYVSGGPTPY